MVTPVVQIFTLPIWIVWISVPALLLTVSGIWPYEFKEFGAMTEGAVDWGFIVGFYVIAAVFMTWLTTRKKADHGA
ncbi:MAG: hypothetical protein V3T70_04375 [Phycisphaerae bacterium]